MQAWEWCICHLLNLAVIAAFGISVDKKKSKNVQARAIFDKLTSMLGSMRSSDGALAWFKALQYEKAGSHLKLKTISPTRWCSVVEVGRQAAYIRMYIFFVTYLPFRLHDGFPHMCPTH